MGINKFAMVKISDESFEHVRSKQDFLSSEFRKLFGPLNLSKYEAYISEDFYRCIDSLKVSCISQSALLVETGKRHYIYVDFIDSLNVNAYAKTIGENSFIGINMGMWIKLNLLFDNILSILFDLDLEEIKEFENIYNSTTSIENKAITNAFTPKTHESFAELERLKIINYDPDIPKTSSTCVILALEYIFCHEFVHIIQGHTRIFEDRKWGVDHLSAVQLEEEKKAPKLFEKKGIINAMELEADNFAANLIGNGFSRGLLFTKKTKENPIKLMWQLSLALTTLFCTFDFAANSVSSYNMSLHPHPGVRMLNFYRGLESSISNFERIYLEHWQQAQQLCFMCIRKIGLNIRLINESFNTEECDKIIKSYEMYSAELQRIKTDFIVTNYTQ